MRFKLILTSLLIFSSIMPALSQDAAESIPKLAADPSFKTGRLDNGINYFFGANPKQKGLYDICLVQKMPQSMSLHQLDSIAAKTLYSVESLSVPFRKFLSRNGIAPTSRGYFHVEQGSICYDFRNLSSAYPESVMDSTLLAVFDLVRMQGREGQPTDAQAIVIAGDFDQKVMLAKMKLLSLITPRTEGAVPQLEYQWDSLSVRHDFQTSTKEGIVHVEATWREPRTPKEYIGTVLPVISDKLAGELGWVLKRRLEPVFAGSNLNVWTTFTHKNSVQGPGDDMIVFSVSCMKNDAAQVEEIVRTEFSRLATWGVSQVEYAYARDSYKFRWMKEICSDRTTNESVAEKCIANFLYGAPLASETEKMKFAYKNLPEDVQTKLFNDYLFRMLSQTSERNERLMPQPLLLSREDMDKSFDSYAPSYTLKVPKPAEEVVTGGLLWKFSNGLNMIHKKCGSKDITHFAYAAKGGRQHVGENDILDIAGIGGDDLKAYLAAYGIDIKARLTPTDVRLEGSVATENLEVLMKVLCAVSLQKATEKVFGPDVYKILILCNDMDGEQFAPLVAKYAPSLRPAGKWTAGKAFAEDTEDVMQLRGFTIYESEFKYDRSGSNKALADVAAYALDEAILREFSDMAVYSGNWSAYQGISAGNYHLIFGVHPYETDGASAYLGHPNRKQMLEGLKNAIRRLASQPVTKTQLETYKAFAKNAHESLAGTPEYYITLSLDRYLDNKNYGARYPLLVNGVTAEAIQKFYATAADTD